MRSATRDLRDLQWSSMDGSQYKISNQPTRLLIISARSDLRVGRDARPKRTKSKRRNKASVKVIR
jgi:hypothetical protein